MSDAVPSRSGRPAICLNMIVRNEAHVIQETLDSVAPYISSWVIVDTGSDDGTQDVIFNHMARRGIPGELHERPWRNFGYNRSEALTLAQGRGDYIWVMDADDTVVGTPDFNRLGADIYCLRIGEADEETFFIYWRPQLFRDGLRVRYEGVVHERATWDDSYVVANLEGDYRIECRHLGARNLDPQKYERDRDLLLAEVERDPEDSRSVFYLAQSYFLLGDFVNARKWYARRAEMEDRQGEVYYAMYRVAQSMAKLGAPWPDVQDAYLRAWELQPARAEPLYYIARTYRDDRRYQLGYTFARHAAEIPLPPQGTIFVRADIYAWRAADEQAVCASWIGKHAEAFALWRRLLARPDLPDDDRQRIADNRDIVAPTMIEAASTYPDALARRLTAGPRDTEVVVSLVAGPDLARAEQTLNSFLNCCTDVSRAGRFLVLDAGLAGEDRAILLERYGFLEFAHAEPAEGPGAQLAALRGQIDARYWLHLGGGWRFFAPESLITRLTAVFDAEPQVFQVGINFADAVELTRAGAPEAAVRRAPGAGRYVLTTQLARGPAMFDTARLDRAGGLHGIDPDPIAALARRAAAAGLRTASLDEVLCIAAVDRARPPAQATEVRHLQPQPQLGRTPFAVAIVSPPDYEHSEAFREVAETLHFGLLALGHDSVMTTRLDLDDRRTIVLGTNLLARYGLEPPKDAILYNLEQIYFDSDDSSWMTPALLDLFRRYPVWDYSQANIERLAALHVPRLTHVPIGYVPELTRIAPAPEDIDVLFYGSTNDERRLAVLDKLRARGLRVKSLFGVYGASRDAWIARSKIVINIHLSYYKAQVFEIARVSYLLANRRAVVSERGTDPTEERDLESGIAFADYDELVDRCVELLGDERARRELGERGYQAFSARSQAAILRRALAADLDRGVEGICSSIDTTSGPAQMYNFNDATATYRFLGMPYLDFLAAIHTHLAPRTYLEVGTESGASLAVARCDAIAVDPQFALQVSATANRRRTLFYQMPSDTFFATENVPGLLGRPVDLAFLDGLHHFEFLLRDLINTEAACHPRSLILLHDCVPLNPRMALRQFVPGDASEGETVYYWTGDVWKLLPILQEYRPDLQLHVLDCPPTGLVAITGVDPESRVLADRYHEIVDQHAASVMDENRLRSLWDELRLTASLPLCDEPDRLAELFRLY